MVPTPRVSGQPKTSPTSKGSKPASNTPASGASVIDPSLVPRADARRFRHELTPAWLVTASMLAGLEPPLELNRPFRAAWLGCGAPFTPLVAAAVHPVADVVAWDPDPATLARVRRLGDEAALTNLTVHEHPTPPSAAPGGGMAGLADLVVVDGVLDSVGEGERPLLIDAVSSLLRPGGLAAVAYRTAVGWSEIAPVVNLIGHLALRGPRDPAAAVDDVKVLLEMIDERGARYFHERPIVRAWLSDLLDTAPDDIVERYVHRELHPISHAQVAEAMSSIGASHVGSARLDPEFPDDASDKLIRQVQRAASPLLREAFSDLASRRAHRVDLFCLGPTFSPSRVRSRRIQGLELTAFAVAGAVDDHHDTGRRRHGLWTKSTGTKLLTGSMVVRDLWSSSTPKQREQQLRTALGAGLVHPVVGPPSGASTDSKVTEQRDGTTSADRLSAVLTSSRVPVAHRHVVAPTLASAVPVAHAATPERRRALGIEA